MAESIGNMQNILSHLRDVKRHGDSYQARCPAHDDDKASLSLGTGDNGKILLKCHAGCSTESILSALGLKWGALFPDEGKPAKADPQISSVYDYVDENGALVFQTVRYMPKDFKQRRPDGRGAWIWNLKGVTPVPYRLPEVIRATTVFLVEGEKDADNLSSLGLTATTNPMGAKKWKPHYNQWFRSKKIAIIPDNDSTGREHAKAVASELLDVAKAVKIINLPGLKPKGDVSDWLANGGSKESLLEILRNTMPFTQVMKPGENSNSCHQQTFPLTDFGNAERFAAMHGENARYCHTWGKWLLWNGIQWTVDETAHIFQLAKETMRSVYAEAAEIRDDDRRKAVVKHARASESSGRIQAMISLAQTELKIATTGSKLDSNPWLLNVLNGTVDLRTGELRPHRRQDFITKCAPVEYNAAAKSPLFFEFLERVMAGSPGLISYLQKLTGYSLTGDTREKCLPVFHGIGNNGKTVLTATIGGMLGDYAQETPVETLMIKKQESIPNDIARLKGARLVTASEGERGQRLAESLIKRLTGGDKISARFLHQEWFEFTPEFKIWLSTNHRPVIRGSDNAIWTRIHLVPFEVTIPKSEQIPRTVMLERLRQEWPGILRWAVEGCLLWQKEGLQKPEEVTRATDDYRADSDVIGGFISDCCTLNPLAKCKTANLYAEYEKWCSENREEPIRIRTFGSVLEERGLKRTRVGTRADKGFQGIGLKSGTDCQTDTDPISRVFPIEKNKEEKKVKSGSGSVCRSVTVCCSECADFEPHPTNPTFQGRCAGNPPDGERLKFPNLEIDCPEFRVKEGGGICS